MYLKAKLREAGYEKINELFCRRAAGAGKSTMVKLLSGKLPEYKVFQEGDYSPVEELAWCAYVTDTCDIWL